MSACSFEGIGLRHLYISLVLCFTLLWPATSEARSYKTWIWLLDGRKIPAYCFLPDYPIRAPLPAVVHAVGVGGQFILQHHDHCQHLANRNFFVILIDPTGYPESLAPGPLSWDRYPGKLFGDINQVVVAARLFFSYEWYLQGMRAAVNYLCSLPIVDRNRIAVSGYSQPANAALTLASSDPRVKAVIWNYGGSPWILPYNVHKLPPVLIFHGTDDTVYNVKYALDLSANLFAANKYYQIYIYPGQEHLFTIYYDLRRETWYSRPVIQDSFEKLVSFLYLTLQPPPLPNIFSHTNSHQ